MDTNAIRAEAAASLEPVAVSLAGETLYVKPVRKWRVSAVKALRDGDFSVWAESALTTDSIDTWNDVDPTIEELEAFFVAWSDATGENAGNSSASQRSSKRTAARSKRTSRATTG